MNSKLRQTLESNLPKGISLKRGNTFWVKKSKKFTVDGERKEKVLTGSVRLGITPDMSDSKAVEHGKIKLQKLLN